MGVSTLYRRAHANRTRDAFANDDAESVGEGYLDYMRDFYADIEETATPSILDQPATGHARVDEQYRIAWDESDPDESLSLYLFQISDWTHVAKETRRSQPLALGGPRWGRQTISVFAPEGWAIEEENDRVENKHFVFTRRVRVDGDKLAITADWRRMSDDVLPAGYPRFRRDLKKVRDLLDYRVRISGDTETGSAADTDVARVTARDVGWPVLALSLVAAFAAWAWRFRERVAIAGIMFRPRRTAPAIVDSARSFGVALTLVGIMGAIDALFELGKDVPGALGSLDVLKLIGLAGAFVVRNFIFIALFLLGFRILRMRVAYSDLFGVSGHALVPLIVGGSGALVAIAGKVSLLDPDSGFFDAGWLGLIVALVLVFTGLGWSLVACARGLAGVAKCSVPRAMGAMATGSATVLLPVAALAFGIAWWAGKA